MTDIIFQYIVFSIFIILLIVGLLVILAEYLPKAILMFWPFRHQKVIEESEIPTTKRKV